MTNAKVGALFSASAHSFSKEEQESLTLIAGEGVAGDAHRGKTVQHLSRIKRDPSQPNLRQVHLIPSELLDDLNAKGFDVQPGDLGENISTRGIDLLGLPRGALLHVGDALLQVTGLRNPCRQIENFRPGLLQEVLGQENGKTVRKAGIMTIVLKGGVVKAGDDIHITLPQEPQEPLEVV
ncbi:MAG: MOSC domain-containing protein [Alphaproteobacteria bacterium]